MLANKISQAKAILHQGGVIAYSTETVLGLGCDPHNASSVNRVLWLKNRAIKEGLILLVADIDSLKKYSKPLTSKQISTITSTDTTTTWLVPANNYVPKWVIGKHEKVAIRVSKLPVVTNLCEFNHAIVSTSANVSGYKTLATNKEITDWFGPHVDYVIISSSGSGIPSKICDLLSGNIIR